MWDCREWTLGGDLLIYYVNLNAVFSYFFVVQIMLCDILEQLSDIVLSLAIMKTNGLCWIPMVFFNVLQKVRNHFTTIYIHSYNFSGNNSLIWTSTWLPLETSLSQSQVTSGYWKEKLTSQNPCCLLAFSLLE